MFSISTAYSAATSDAYLTLLQKQLDTAKKNAAAIDAISVRAGQDQKAIARQRVKEIKEQIDALRRMLALFGGKDAKSVLQQLKQLASQLKQAAGVLMASSESGLPDVSGYQPPEEGTSTADPAAAAETADVDAYDEGRSAYAAQQSSADAEATGSLQLPAAVYDPQRAEDERQLEAAAQALKSLRTALERVVKQQEQQQR